MKTKGFTLIDLLATLAVAGIVFFYALPNLSTMLDKHRSKAVGYSLVNVVSLARQTAISTGSITTICGSTDRLNCDRGWSEGILVFVDRGVQGVVDGADEVIRYAQVISKGEISWRAFQNKGYLQFQGNGFTNYHNGSLRYCPESRDARFAKQLILNVGGRVRMAPDQNGNGIPEGTDGKDIEC
jgi:type IV fimbrial biogenesis protein FimT